MSNKDCAVQATRHNEGKPDYSLIPIRILADNLSELTSWNGEVEHNGIECLVFLASFQETLNPIHLTGCASALFDYQDDMMRVFSFGCEKYGAFNWCKGMDWSKVLASAVRHCVAHTRAIFSGDSSKTLDSESGFPHLAHALCNIYMLQYYTRSYVSLNDLHNFQDGDLPDA